MAETAHQQAANQSPELAKKIEGNAQIANLYMALLGKLVVESQKRGKPMAGITIGKVMASGMTLKFRVNFSSLIMPPTPEFVNSRYSDEYDYIAAKAKGLAVAMQRNPEFIRLLNDLVGTCERIASFKCIPFNYLRVKQAFLGKDEDILVIELADGRKEASNGIAKV